MAPRRTSVLAFRRLSMGGPNGRPLISDARWRVYEWLFHHGPLTGRELNAGLARPGEASASFHKRLSELRDMRLVAEVGVRPCTVSGEHAIAWDVTDHVPDVPANGAIQPPGQAARSAQAADLRGALAIERAVTQHHRAFLEEAHARLSDLDPLAAARLRVDLARLQASRRHWLENPRVSPLPPAMLDFEVCSACGAQEAFRGSCGACGQITNRERQS